MTDMDFPTPEQAAGGDPLGEPGTIKENAQCRI